MLGHYKTSHLDYWVPIFNQPEDRLYGIGEQNLSCMSLTVTWNMSYNYLFGRFTKPLRIKLYNAAQHTHRCLFLGSIFIGVSSAFMYQNVSFNFHCISCVLLNVFSMSHGDFCIQTRVSRQGQMCPATCCPVFPIISEGGGVLLECWSLLSLGITERMGRDRCSRHHQS